MSMTPLEQQIGAILQDPQQLQKVFALAQSLGLSPPQSSPPEPHAEPSPAPAAPPSFSQSAPQAAVSDALGDLLQKAGQLDRRQENLLNALKPFLRPERREKIDRAMQAARISRLAGAALRSRDPKEL